MLVRLAPPPQQPADGGYPQGTPAARSTPVFVSSSCSNAMGPAILVIWRSLVRIAHVFVQKGHRVSGTWHFLQDVAMDIKCLD